MGAQMAVGMAMAQQMMNQTGGMLGEPGDARHSGTGAPPRRARPLRRRICSRPAQVAQMLGVGEADVVASLESGDLKGKKIGTQWRVTKTAVDQFLHS